MTTMPTTTPVHLRRIKRPGPKGKTREEWTLRWHGIDGKHYSKRLDDCARMTKREAEAQRRTFQESMNRREVPRDPPAKMTLSEFAEYHAEIIGEDRKPTTLYEYQLALRLAMGVLGERRAIQDITPLDAARVRNQLKGSAATRAKHVMRLRAIFGHAKRWGILHSDNPFTNQPIPRFSPRSMRIFSIEEIEAMLEAAPTLWWRAFLLLAVTSGLRKEELANLLWADVDMQERVVRVTAKKTESFTGPDCHEYATQAWTPKTYALRSVPVPDRTVEALKGLREQLDGSPYVFVSLERLGLINAKQRAGVRRGKAETLNNLLRDFRVIQKHAAKRLGVDDWEYGAVHDLRRTYATRLAAVVPMTTLQQWLGHSDISVTARFYVGQEVGHAERARRALQL